MTDQLAPPANFAFAPLTNTPLSDSATEFVIDDKAIDIVQWPTPSPVDYYAVVWPRSLYPSVADAFREGAAEVFRVTGKDAGTATLTVARSQLGTSAIELNAAGATYWIQYGISSDLINKIDAGLWVTSGTTKSHVGDVEITGAISASGTLESGSAAITGNVAASGNVVAGGDVSGVDGALSGDLTVGDDADVTGDLTAASAAIAGTAIIKGKTPWIDVTHADYGADPTGVEDSATAIQAALTAAQSISSVGGNAAIVFVPRGTYSIGSALTLTGGATILGAGVRGGTELVYSGTDGADLLTIHDTGSSDIAEFVRIEGVRFRGTGDEESGGAIYLNNCYRISIERCVFVDFGGGTVALASRRPAIAAYYDSGASNSMSDGLRVRDCAFLANLGGGVRVWNGGKGVIVEGCDFLTNNKYGVCIAAADHMSVMRCNFDGYGHEKNSLTGDFSYPVTIAGGVGHSIVDCDFTDYGGTAGDQGCAIITGHNGHTQAASTVQSHRLRVEGCDFEESDYSTCICLQYQHGMIVIGCQFHYDSNTERYGVEFVSGTPLLEMAATLFVGNQWNLANDLGTAFPSADRVINTGNTPYAWLEMTNTGSGPTLLLSGSGVTDEIVISPGDAGTTELPTISMNGPTITSGAGAPSSGAADGSLYLRNDGTGPNLYIRENNVWEVAAVVP